MRMKNREHKTQFRYASPRFLFFSIVVLLLLLSILFLSACEKEAVPEPPPQPITEPFEKSTDAEILQQYPDDLDEALKELEVTEE